MCIDAVATIFVTITTPETRELEKLFLLLASSSLWKVSISDSVEVLKMVEFFYDNRNFCFTSNARHSLKIFHCLKDYLKTIA